MKRREFVRKLEAAGVALKRAGSGHDIYYNPATKRSAPVPRHTEIPETLCKLIERQLAIGGGS
ncbi:MAG TPA: type II toxin-antitoxin system HicA family toxin [Bryobacteraceae bacterium]|nr:type II toxin-antitoxin system HicA family toxin [Bryobacteraceae bacterium]